MTKAKFDLNEFRIDKSKQEQGVWVDFGAGAKFKLAHSKSSAFSEAFTKATEPYKATGREPSTEEMEDILVDCMANYLVLDWKEVYLEDKALKYNIETCKKILRDFPELRDRLFDQGTKSSNFKDKRDKEIVKNSKAASSGKPSTETD